ncbi:RNAse P, Rpr2/Rpp21 subunit [Melia azedarach]|uniref:RNAse P, Rpr2/Rpp21 subunit n=1 Tax=Melia azedarach TaxID=155640 RepID=A0ACC1XMB2_MELAZ|nr:RNAse P, Rpr2/Rpp21 subunit [Melia azedarach]
MGKRGGDRRTSNLPSVSHKPLSLREEKAGKKQTNMVNVKSKLKLKHFQNLAVWASGEASVPSLAALFGHRLASANEALGLQPDPSLFSCQRCETILQPGFNCTIRIEKNQVNARRRCKKRKTSTQNTVVYKCHFCSHRNLKRGSPKGHMKEICPKQPLQLERLKSSLRKFADSVEDKRSKDEICKVDEIALPAIESSLDKSADLVKDTKSKDEVCKVDEIALPAIARESPTCSSPTTPSVKTKITLEAKKRRRNKLGTKTPAEYESKSAITDTEKTTVVSTKRKRKSWTSLKEIAERSEHDNGQNSQNIANLAIPFSL